jgi:hypothetical protein
MRAWLTALAFALGASAAQAQMGLPFGAYEPTPAFLAPSHNSVNNCSATPPPDPYNRNQQRGQQATERAAAPDCPGR